MVWCISTAHCNREVMCLAETYQPAHWPRAGFQPPVTLSDEVVCVSCYSKLFALSIIPLLRTVKTNCFTAQSSETQEICLIKALY